MSRVTSRAGWVLALVLSLLVVASVTGVVRGGPLDPPGPPGPTQPQIEPRIPIDHLPFDITAPGSYFLTQDLIAPTDTAGITLGNDANGVTIDLNGFALQGDTALFDGIAGPGQLSLHHRPEGEERRHPRLAQRHRRRPGELARVRRHRRVAEQRLRHPRRRARDDPPLPRREQRRARHRAGGAERRRRHRRWLHRLRQHAERHRDRRQRRGAGHQQRVDGQHRRRHPHRHHARTTCGSRATTSAATGTTACSSSQTTTSPCATPPRATRPPTSHSPQATSRPNKAHRSRTRSQT